MTPDQFTLEERMIEAGDGHRLYVHHWGDQAADRVTVYLHGGPGSGCRDKDKSLFDPAKQRVVFIDQRGCGKSTPYGSVENNDIDRLVEDINTVTIALGIERFNLVGGSWGSCLALTYAIRNPERVTSMVLRGIFTGRQREIDFLDKGEFRAFFPDVWEKFVKSVPIEHQEDPGAYHVSRMLGDDPVAAKRSAYAYSQLEGSVVSLDDRVKDADFETFDPASSKIECHYLAHNCFLPEGYIMAHASELTMPVHLVQGRYDAICPPFTAYELSVKLPNGTLTWTTAGHSGGDRANWEAVKILLRSAK